MFATNGILFNHESPCAARLSSPEKLPGVSLKSALASRIKSTWVTWMPNATGSRKRLCRSDVAHPAAGRTGRFCDRYRRYHQVRDFVRMAFGEIGIELEFKGKDEKEYAVVASCSNPDFIVEIGKVVVAVDPKYYRPTEVDLLLGDPTKAQQKLGWKPKYDLPALVNEMVESRRNPVPSPEIATGFRLHDHESVRITNLLFTPKLQQMQSTSKVYIAGHRGMVGSAILQRLLRDASLILLSEDRMSSICATRQQ